MYINDDEVGDDEYNKEDFLEYLNELFGYIDDNYFDEVEYEVNGKDIMVNITYKEYSFEDAFVSIDCSFRYEDPEIVLTSIDTLRFYMVYTGAWEGYDEYGYFEGTDKYEIDDYYEYGYYEGYYGYEDY